MANRQLPDRPQEVTTRQHQRDALLQEAMHRPGIREVMRVYEDWKRADRVVESHRAITGWRGRITNRTNACEKG